MPASSVQANKPTSAFPRGLPELGPQNYLQLPSGVEFLQAVHRLLSVHAGCHGGTVLEDRATARSGVKMDRRERRDTQEGRLGAHTSTLVLMHPSPETYDQSCTEPKGPLAPPAETLAGVCYPPTTFAPCSFCIWLAESWALPGADPCAWITSPAVGGWKSWWNWGVMALTRP